MPALYVPSLDGTTLVLSRTHNGFDEDIFVDPATIGKFLLIIAGGATIGYVLVCRIKAL